MRIQEIMSRDLSTVTPDATVREAALLMKREEVGFLPVVSSSDSRKLVGVVTDRDIAIRCIATGRDGDCRVSEVMSSGPVATCRQTDDVEHLMSSMRSEQVRRIPIVDDRGSLVGIVSQADIVRKARGGQPEATISQISEPGGRHAS
jgi:CBS domain-containing protein